jgi:hypothetical protein
VAAFGSDKLKRALKESHTVVSRMVATNGGASIDVDVLSGSITQDYDATSRWSMDVELPVPDDFSTDAFRSFLNTKLTTLQPWKGVKFDDTGTSELVKFATFYTTDIENSEDDNGAPTMKVQALDRSCRAQGDIGNTIVVSLGASPSLVVPQILAKKIPHATYALASTGFRTPALLLQPNSDAWEESTRLMSSVGQALYFDREDRCVSSLRALVPSTDYVWHYDENSFPDFANVKRHATNDLFPNVVRVVSTNPGTPNVVGEAADLNPKSPTYRYGDYGEQVQTFQSEQVTTTDQANTMALYLLSKLLGPQDEVTFNAVPNPLLDVGDTILMTYTPEGLRAAPLLLTNIRMPLTVGDSMEVTARPSLFSNATLLPVGSL